MLLVAALILAVPVYPMAGKLLTEKCRLPYGVQRILKTMVMIALISVCTVRLVGNSHNPFLYFRF